VNPDGRPAAFQIAALRLAVALCLLGLAVVEAPAQERPLNADKNWRITVGAARTWPNLEDANHNTRLVQSQMNSKGANVDLPMWGGEFTPNIALGAYRRLPFWDGRVWAGCLLSYSQSDHSFSQSPLPAWDGVSPGARYEQDFRFAGADLSFMLEALRFKRVVATVGGAVGLGYLESDIDAALYAPGFVSGGHTKIRFSDVSPTAAVTAGVSYLFTENIALNLSARYSWRSFSGDAPVDAMVFSEGFAASQRLTKDAYVDLSGPSVGLFLEFFL